MLTILLLMNGFFTNRFFGDVDEECCIKETGDLREQKPRKIKVINCKRRAHTLPETKNGLRKK